MADDQQTSLTDEDIFSPVYCRRCHAHSPRAIVRRYHGLCLECICAIYYASTGIGRCQECASANLRLIGMTVVCNYCRHECSVPAFHLSLLKGQFLRNRQEWVERIRPVLFEVDSAMGVEAHISVLLGPRNDVRDTLLDIGTFNRVFFSIDKIAETAREVGATKVVVAHNHPGVLSSAPSDLDVETAARLLVYLGERGVQVVDNLVACRGTTGPELKSVMNTKRFKDQIRAY